MHLLLSVIPTSLQCITKIILINIVQINQCVEMNHNRFLSASIIISAINLLLIKPFKQYLRLVIASLIK